MQECTIPEKLAAFFREHPAVALAFSGGVDSAYLLYAACQAGARVRAYYVHSQFQPQFELDDARRLCRELGAEMRELPVDVLACERVASNPENRCYYCKRKIFETILEAARQDGFSVVLDGTNASDDADDRPGMRALRELEVCSPLRLCGMTKREIRAASAAAGLFTAEKPAYACLATRIPTGQTITAADLSRIDQAEMALRAMGFSDLRVRLFHGAARIQLPEGQLAEAARRWEDILAALPAFSAVLLDLKPRNGVST